jgi:hypothetical protein
LKNLLNNAFHGRVDAGPRPVFCGMIPWEKPAFDSPYELWREEGLVFLVLAGHVELGLREMKEMIRQIAAIDADGTAPIIMECRHGAHVGEDARNLVCRACGQKGHPVALLTTDLDIRLQGEVFKQVQQPHFPFRVFSTRNEATRWARERRQLKVIAGRS